MSAFWAALGFGTPLALWGLLALPVIWWLLRFVPPRPRPQAFPPIRILLGLDPKLETPDKTPWWLLLLRLALAAALIFAVAQPELRSRHAATGMGGHTLVVVDNGWAAASDWSRRQDYLLGLLEEVQNDGGLVTLVPTVKKNSTQGLRTVAAADAIDAAKALEPAALAPDRISLVTSLKAAGLDAPDRIVWLSDGLAAGKFAADLAGTFPRSALTVVTVKASDLPVALAKPIATGADIRTAVLKTRGVVQPPQLVQARAANSRVLAEQLVTLGQDTGETSVTLSLPTELRNDVQSISIAGVDHGGARLLLDDRWRRKTVALQTGASFETEQPLLSPLHYITRALEPYAEMQEPKSPQDLKALLDGGVSMLVLADIGIVSDAVRGDVEDWVAKGGLLLRFAGPRLAAAADDLVPVRLRDGGRELGSALSWEKPQGLQDFNADSPFAGLSLDERATVSQQVLAEPDGELAMRTWASLADGTPLVTAARRGKGLIVLFHVTGNPEWSSLPLTGLFVGMLKRITDLAPPAGSTGSAAATGLQVNAAYVPRLMLSGRGDLVPPDADIQPIAFAAFNSAMATPLTPPGLYARGGGERAINLDLTAGDLAPLGALPAGVASTDYTPPQKTAYAPWLFLLAFGLFLLDTLAALFMGGGWQRLRTAGAAGAIMAVMMIAHTDSRVMAQETVAPADFDQMAMQAALNTRLAFVRTGKSDIDDVSSEGLSGLGFVINDRTSINLADPVGIDIERDDLVFYPLIYWPVDIDAQAPSAAAIQKIDTYMKKGGTIFFDLRDDGLSAGSLGNDENPTTEALRRILGKLDIPPLETVAEQHVLTRSFYLLNAFPGRYASGPLWVEAGNSGQVSDPGTADGVSAIIIGSNDYAAAWAFDAQGEPLYAVIPGEDRQREFAFRTGINIVMYALTGNYKADQVHIPALLERLGQ